MLRLNDVRYRYRADAPWAVDGVSLALGRGEVLGLLGPNGAGKSTLMALVAGLRRPQAGAVELAEPAAVRGGFALVPQEYAFYPMLTCRENLEFFAGVLGLDGERARARIAAALAAVGLDAVAERRAAECSGGLKRRLNLAIGLVGDPQLLLLDEPTVGVDPQSRAFLLETVRRLRAEGRAIIYASHYMEEVQAIGDRVAVIDHGRVLTCGPLADLLAGATANVEVRVARAPDAALRARLAAECGLAAGSIGDDGWLEFALPAERLLEELLRDVRALAGPIVAVRHGCRDLEELFLQLTHHSLRD
ncbi:MAG TPA: ABC transporter ATP-binding protein [Opitutaceae bacterium]|nr:ABC transporter ATP-binding protein [Opitutaceae bacterium]